jgi:hypothetical protein
VANAEPLTITLDNFSQRNNIELTPKSHTSDEDRLMGQTPGTLVATLVAILQGGHQILARGTHQNMINISDIVRHSMENCIIIRNIVNNYIVLDDDQSH